MPQHKQFGKAAWSPAVRQGALPPSTGAEPMPRLIRMVMGVGQASGQTATRKVGLRGTLASWGVRASGCV